ncbi:uncharacterized protein UBRO_20194 [Ustilago bromivora]|uniref:Uncharacterized protein n=1 Tax=Ustilago bromivora TaxID=307758 RepID=A0A1K0H722_9BASI|nr:uncharacterized protein UBRO_20194 [Ustilago bromivora]
MPHAFHVQTTRTVLLTQHPSSSSLWLNLAKQMRPSSWPLAMNTLSILSSSMRCLCLLFQHFTWLKTPLFCKNDSIKTHSSVSNLHPPFLTTTTPHLHQLSLNYPTTIQCHLSVPTIIIAMRSALALLQPSLTNRTIQLMHPPLLPSTNSKSKEPCQLSTLPRKIPVIMLLPCLLNNATMAMMKSWRIFTWPSPTNKLSSPSLLEDLYGLPNVLINQLSLLRSSPFLSLTTPEYLPAQYIGISPETLTSIKKKTSQEAPFDFKPNNRCNPMAFRHWNVLSTFLAALVITDLWRSWCLAANWSLSVRFPWSSTGLVSNVFLLAQPFPTMLLPSRSLTFPKLTHQPLPPAMWLNLSKLTFRYMMFGFVRSLTTMALHPQLTPMFTLPSSLPQLEMKEALIWSNFAPFLATSGFSLMTVSSITSGDSSGAHHARVGLNTSTPFKNALVAFATNANALDTSLPHVLVPLMMLAIQMLPFSKRKRMAVVPTTLTMAPKHTLFSSSLFVATWNCATLNEPSCVAALHNPSTPLGKAEIVFIQEMQLASPHQLLTTNPLLRLHHHSRTSSNSWSRLWHSNLKHQVEDRGDLLSPLHNIHKDMHSGFQACFGAIHLYPAVVEHPCTT